MTFYKYNLYRLHYRVTIQGVRRKISAVTQYVHQIKLMQSCIMFPKRVLCNNFEINLMTNCNHYYRVYQSKLLYNSVFLVTRFNVTKNRFYVYGYFFFPDTLYVEIKITM